MVYAGAIGIRYGVGEQEYMKGVQPLEEQNYTRTRKRHLQTETHKSALTDRMGQKDHTIYWKGMRLPAKEPAYKK